MTLSLPITELLAWRDDETARWREWLPAHPAALELSLGDGRFPTVGALIGHIGSVELRHGQRLLGEPVTPPEEIAPRGIEELFALLDRGRALLGRFLVEAEERDLESTLTFDTIGAGRVTVTRWRVLWNLPLHGARHWAQVAAAVRSAGMAAEWPHDFIFAEIAAGRGGK